METQEPSWSGNTRGSAPKGTDPSRLVLSSGCLIHESAMQTRGGEESPATQVWVQVARATGMSRIEELDRRAAAPSRVRHRVGVMPWHRRSAAVK